MINANEYWQFIQTSGADLLTANNFLAIAMDNSNVYFKIGDGFSYLFLHSKLPGGLSRVVSLGVFPCSQMVARGRIIWRHLFS